MSDKTKMRYEVRTQPDPTDPTGARKVLVPAIVERPDTLSLQQVVFNAIDTGRIAGLKTGAARNIAEGVADQMYQEFLKGNSISFGRYFHASLYLDGTVGADGNLTNANKVNVRLKQGPDFRVSRNDFSWVNIASDKTPKIEFLISAAAGAVRSQLVRGQAIMLNGVRFGDDDTALAVKASYTIGDTTTTVTPRISSSGENLIALTWPQEFNELEAGQEIEFTVTRTADEETLVSMPCKAWLAS